MNKIILSFLFFLFINVDSFSQNDKRKIFAKYVDEEIILDGEMNEQFWLDAQSSTGFVQYRPRDSVSADLDTEFRVAYGEKFLYIIAKMEDIPSKKFIVGDLKRDFYGGSTDYIAFLFDTFQDETNGYNFGISPFGIQREALLSDGGEGYFSMGGGGGSRGGISWFNINWNTKWFSGAKLYEEGYWIAEFKIPFNSIRYKEGSKVWNFNSYRGNSKINESSVWTVIPLGYSPANLSMTGELEFEYPLKKSSQNLVVIPYISGSGIRNKISEPDKDSNFDAGIDMKMALSSSINLDLTFNPDFSQVEVDEQRTNLTRFELFLPEKREFFNDNADLFSNLGSRESRPMFTRRIGIAKDTTTSQYVQNPIIYGAKLSGKITDDLRVGVLNMQTARLSSSGIPSYNYGMAVLEKNILKNSKISSFFINKQSLFNNKSNDYVHELDRFNRVFGIESKLQSNNTRFKSEFYYHHSFENFNKSQSNAYGANASYEKRNFETNVYFYGVGKNYNPELGFVPRKDYVFLSPSFKYKFLPENSSINTHGPGIDYEFYKNKENGVTDYEIDIDYNFSFRSDASLTLKSNILYTKLLYDFDPSRSDGISLPALSEYNYTNYTFYFRTSQRKLFSFRLNGKVGDFFNGNINNIGGTMTYKVPPYLNIEIGSQYNSLKFPEPFSSAEFFSLNSKINVSFSKDLFLSTYLQYNNQLDNININARFQWRFQPLSDIFLVYTDNYFAENPMFMKLKNRSFAFKINYWINI